MKINFRIDWGYQYLYSRRHYHPTYIWDGNLSCGNGTIEKTFKLDYPYIMFGTGFTAKETELSMPSWQDKTKRGISGVRFEADVNDDTIFHLNTASFSASFKAKDIIEKGRIEFPVGPKYLGCFVIITKTDYYWFKPAHKENETIFESDELSAPVHPWMRMKLAFVEPGKRLKFNVDVNEPKKDFQELLIHMVAMAAPGFSEEQTEAVSVIPYEIFVDGKSVLKTERFYRFHDRMMQLLEDDWKRINITPGNHFIEIQNNDDAVYLCVDRITVKVCEFNHGELSVPQWKLRDESVTASVFATHDDKISVYFDNTEICVDCKKGWNEFKVDSKTIGKLEIKTNKDSKFIEIYDIEEEANPVKVGYDMTVVPHDKNGYMDWLLNYTHRTRLGNYVIFRDFRHYGKKYEHVTTYQDKYNWAEYLKNNGVYVSACTDFDDKGFIDGAGEMFNECGRHEVSGISYGADPMDEYRSNDMKEATETFIKYYKGLVDDIHKLGAPAAFGDACGGIRHSILAGADFVRAETMVGPQMPLLGKTRAAVESLGSGRWGVHIAIQHHYPVYTEKHLGMYFISLMQPWCMGAELIYEEDSLFELFKEERQAWDDYLTKGKRDMTRNFFKFVKTHPRKGKNIRKIALLEGRYAAPFHNFICGPEQDPHYCVWGALGNDGEEWGHLQPEKCQQVYDVLMPGTSTHPLRQKFDKRRFFFSGTPYGDFDYIPIEANADYFKNYNFIANLGWNTMLKDDFDKIVEFVKDGGTYLTGIPQFSTHIKRDFLMNMTDLSLYNNGDLSDISGIKVKGIGEEYCGQWNCKNRQEIEESELSAMPSDGVAEDGTPMLCDLELCGAEVVCWDTASGKPMLVKYKLGKGYVYTFTMWAYPGHEQFQRFSATWLEILCNEHKTNIYVEDESKEVFWTVWQDENETKVMLINTDWSQKDNVKNVNLVFGNNTATIDVIERKLAIATVKGTSVNVEYFEI